MVKEKYLNNLYQTIWLSDEEILLLTLDDLDLSSGKLSVWQIKDDKVRDFIIAIPEQTFARLSYNSSNNYLAVTVPSGIYETLYLVNIRTGQIYEQETFYSPLLNLQWSKANTLFFYEEKIGRASCREKV